MTFQESFQESTPDPTITVLVAALLRHVLTFLAGLGLAIGAYSDSTLMIMAGALVSIGMLSWSIYQKVAAARAAHAGAVRSAETGKPQLSKTGVSNAKL